MKNNNDKHNEIIINKNSNRQKNDKGAKNNNHCDEKEYLFCYEEKINQNNATDLENQRTKLTELLDQKIKEVKDKETEKEKETKK